MKSNFLQGNEIPIKIPVSHYAQYVSDDAMIRMVAAATVTSTGQIAIKEVVANLGKPTLKMEDLPDNFTVWKESEFYVSFTNPLDKKLTNCEMYIDGSIIKDRIYMAKLE